MASYGANDQMAFALLNAWWSELKLCVLKMANSISHEAQHSRDSKLVSRSCIKYYSDWKLSDGRAFMANGICYSLHTETETWKKRKERKKKEKLSIETWWNTKRTIHVLRAYRQWKPISELWSVCFFILSSDDVDDLRCNIIFTFFNDINYSKARWWNEK